MCRPPPMVAAAAAATAVCQVRANKDGVGWRDSCGGGAASETSCVCLWQVVVVVVIVNVVASFCPQVFFSQHSQLL